MLVLGAINHIQVSIALCASGVDVASACVLRAHITAVVLGVQAVGQNTSQEHQGGIVPGKPLASMALTLSVHSFQFAIQCLWSWFTLALRSRLRHT